MNLQERIEALETEFADKIKTLKAEAQREDKFPQDGDLYWYIDSDGEVLSSEWERFPSEEHMLEVGNIFHTEEEAKFAVEKLKVEAELRKFSRPFKHGAKNHTINYNHETEMVVNVNATATYQETGSFYFDSYEEVVEAIESIGEERIKKYIFGVEE